MPFPKLLSLRLLTGMFVLVTIVAVFWHWFAYEQFLNTPLGYSNNKAIMLVEKGATVNQLTYRWKKQGLIENQFYLKLFCWLNPEYQNIKAGEYLISKSDTPLSVLKILSQGKVIQYAFTIVEGVNSHELMSQLAQEKNLKTNFDIQTQWLNQKLEIPTDNIEGWFYPDTYYYDKNSSSLSLLKRATKKMQQVLAEEWQNRSLNLPYKTPYEALIMASIIEKETGLPSERKKIAGVFVRRLQKRMRLQTDPTVIYGIGPSFNGDITYKNLKTKTPYNTYIIKGLPPTPIAMPGRESINAALHPEIGEALYFVATGDGGHYFSRTLKEHNEAVRRYQLNR
ncbi:endolytic transglycosylase MltG [Aliikangiella sp. IMCC44359]|uniref:endolytic transglycosylase MltG n=1 Tax=Aliikangiella sp. IMCC44359 TaxID=3459125 RepID=UPI00403A9B8A